MALLVVLVALDFSVSPVAAIGRTLVRGSSALGWSPIPSGTIGMSDSQPLAPCNRSGGAACSRHGCIRDTFRTVGSLGRPLVPAGAVPAAAPVVTVLVVALAVPGRQQPGWTDRSHRRAMQQLLSP